MTTSPLLLSDRKSALAGFGSLAILACAVAPALTRSIPQLPLASPEAAARVAVPATAAAVNTTKAVVAAIAPTQAQPQPPSPEAAPKAPAIAFKAPQTQATVQANGYYEQLRAKLRWVSVKMGEDRLRTPDHGSRLLLAQSAARRAGLDEVGLNHRDVYGIINAETSWIPRLGASKDGTPNLGIAQFEPATARALGLRNPNDPVEAVHVAALHLKEAAEWSAKRIAPLKLSPQDRAVKLREGVSVYYNLSTKGRAAWNGLNTAQLPRETQLHIKNARRGMMEAATLEAQLRNVRVLTQVKADGAVALNAAPKDAGI
jgi:hypothetical protein